MNSLLNMVDVQSTSSSVDGGYAIENKLNEDEDKDDEESSTDSVGKRKMSDDEDKDSDTEEETSEPAKKRCKLKRKDRNRRKNIQSVLNVDELDEQTKSAKVQEIERLKRLQELQLRARYEQQQISMEMEKRRAELYGKRFHNGGSVSEVVNLISSSGSENEESKVQKSDDDVEIIPVCQEDDEDPSNSGMHVNDAYNVPDSQGRILINVGHPEKDPDVFIASQLENVLKPHQIGGVRFLYDNLIESLSNYESVGYGCILAHSMGLGKTIQVVSFTEIFLRETPGKHVLIIVPINTIQNWYNEYNQWVPSSSSSSFSSESFKPRSFQVFVLNDTCKNLEQRGQLIETWYYKGGVLLMGYELYRQLANKKPRKKKTKKSTLMPECIDIEEEDKEKIILDRIQCALIDPGPDLVICDEGHRIKNSHASISQALKALKTRRRVVLTGYPLQNNLLEYWCMVDFVRPNFLGTKNEFSNMFERPIQNGQCVDSLPKDVRLMKHRAHVLHNQLKGFVQRRSHKVLKDSLPPKEEHVLMLRMTPFQRNLYKEFMKDLLSSNSVTNPLKAFAVALKIYNHPDVLYNFLKKRELNNATDFDIEFDEFGALTYSSKSNKMPNALKKDEINYDWSYAGMKDYQDGIAENSTKLPVFLTLLREAIKCGDRMLLFSQSLLTLDVIENFLRHEEPNMLYYRLDGSTSGMDREKLIRSFNADDTIKLFLISTKAGSLGINLIGANRVVVFDASWNPCHDSQAVCRVYRYGQPKTSFIYRLIADNSIEKSIYDRQINKQGMSNRIVDALNPELRFQTKEIQKLLRDDEDDPSPSDINIKCETIEDDVLRTAIVQHANLLTQSPFTHESLLIDRRDQKLSKAEKRIAERSYQIEKDSKISYGRPSYAAFYPKTGMETVQNYDHHNSQNQPYSQSSSSREVFVSGGNMSGVSSSFGRPPINMPLNSPTLESQPMSEFQRRMTSSSSPPSDSSSFPLEALSRQGVSFKHLVVQSDLIIPTNVPNAPSLELKKGQKIMIIQTAKGVYIRMGDKIIKIRLPMDLLKHITKPVPAEVVTLSDSDSDQTNAIPKK